MGSGSSALSVASEWRDGDPLAVFSSVERLCRQGHFMKNADDFSVAVGEAIRQSQLDILEILLPSGNSRLLEPHPLLTAATHGVLDAMEILFSAGFDVAAIGDSGRTALHVCAAQKSIDSASCASFLTLKGGLRLCRFRSVEGYTCFHIAAKKNNLLFFAHVLPCIKDIDQIHALLNMPDREGVSARQLAKQYKYEELLALMDSYTAGLGHQMGNAKEGKKKLKSAVDEKRMMQVWERFFENAARRMLGDELGNEQYEQGNNQSPPLAPYDPWDDPAYSGANHTGSTNSAGCVVNSYRKSSPSSNRSKQWSSDNNDNDDPEDIALAVKRYYEGVLCYESANQHSRTYYVLNQASGGSAWLDDHLKALSAYSNGLVRTKLDRELLRVAERVPHFVRDTLRLGWMTYFDLLSNQVMWINVHTWACQHALPLAGDPLLDAAGLLHTQGWEEMSSGGSGTGSEDIYPDQALSESWVLVVSEKEKEKEKGKEGGLERGKRGSRGGEASNPAPSSWDVWDLADDDEESNEFEGEANTSGSSISSSGNRNTQGEDREKDREKEPSYYYNRMSGHTAWEKPMNYDQIVQARGGWALVTSEESQWCYYWFHQETGESVWVE